MANEASPDSPVHQDPWAFPVVWEKWDRKGCPALPVPEAKPGRAASVANPVPLDRQALLAFPVSKVTKANKVPTANP